MFQKAIEQARRYTCPYAGLRRKDDGTVFSTVAAFVVVNEEGWCLTAKHVFDEAASAQLTAHVEIWAAGVDWGKTTPRATDVHLHRSADLALFRLDPFVPPSNQAYPVLRAEELVPGLSVCRIGFPWHSVDARFDGNGFEVRSGFPAPIFALDGIISRFLIEERPDGSKARYVQTSSPGLRGQSGGPLFDVDARLCGIQSSTTHLDLGFDASYQRDGITTVERQFLNVGQAVHVGDVAAFLDVHGIAYASR